MTFWNILMKLKNYFPVLSNSYVTFQQWWGGGTCYRGTCGWCVCGSGWGSAFSMKLFHLDWTDNLKWPGASMPLLLLINSWCRMKVGFVGLQRCGWDGAVCVGVEEWGICGHLETFPLTLQLFFNRQWWVVPYQECDKLTLYMFSC